MERKIKYTILLASAMVLFVIGCKKNDSSTTNPVVTQARIKTLTMLPSGNVITYYYDSLKRIARTTTSGSAGYLSYVYKGTDSIIGYVSNGVDSTRFIAYKLNGVGLAMNASASSGPTTFTYTYEINGHQVYGTSNSALGTTADTFTIAGNNVPEHRYSISNVLTTTNTQRKQVFTYFTDKTNTAGNENKGMSFLGKSNANLVNTEAYHVSSVTLIPPGTATSDETYNYTYTYDSSGRVTQMVKTAVSNGAATSEAYTYY